LKLKLRKHWGGRIKEALRFDRGQANRGRRTGTAMEKFLKGVTLPEKFEENSDFASQKR